MDHLKQSEAEKVLRNWNELINHSKSQSVSKEANTVYLVRLEGAFCISISFIKKQMLNLDKYCSQLNQLKATNDDKHQKLVNWKEFISHPDNVKAYISLKTYKKLLQLGCPTTLVVVIWPCIFGLFIILISIKILLMGRTSIL